MQPHYPNPEYREPAIEFDGYFRLTEKSRATVTGDGSGILELLPGESRIVPPVGRRKEYPEHYANIPKWLEDERAKAEAAAKAAEEEKLARIRAENYARNHPNEAANDDNRSGAEEEKDNEDDGNNGAEGGGGSRPESRHTDSRKALTSGGSEDTLKSEELRALEEKQLRDLEMGSRW